MIAVHHALKASAKDKGLTLETALRGTGDLAAIADAVWGLQCVDEDRLEIRLQCVKARDFEPPHPFNILGRPYLNQIGDFVMAEQELSEPEEAEAEALARYVSKTPQATYRQVFHATGTPLKRIKTVAAKAGWSKKGKFWEQGAPESSPHASDLFPRSPS